MSNYDESRAIEYDSPYDPRDDYAPEEIYPFEEPEPITSDTMTDEQWFEVA